MFSLSVFSTLAVLIHIAPHQQSCVHHIARGEFCEVLGVPRVHRPTQPAPDAAPQCPLLADS